MPEKKLTKEELSQARSRFITAINEGVSELFDLSKPHGLWRNSWYGVEDVGEAYFRVNGRNRYIQIGSVGINERYQGHGFLKAIVSLLIMKMDREMERMFRLIKLENIHNPRCVCNFLEQFSREWTILRREQHEVRTIYLVRKGYESEYERHTFSN